MAVIIDDRALLRDLMVEYLRGLRIQQEILVHERLHSVSTKSLNSLNMSFDAGLGINVLITKHLFARLNTDFTYSLMQDMTLGMVIPELSIGIRF